MNNINSLYRYQLRISKLSAMNPTIITAYIPGVLFSTILLRTRTHARARGHTHGCIRKHAGDVSMCRLIGSNNCRCRAPTLVYCRIEMKGD